MFPLSGIDSPQPTVSNLGYLLPIGGKLIVGLHKFTESCENGMSFTTVSSVPRNRFNVDHDVPPRLASLISVV